MVEQVVSDTHAVEQMPGGEVDVGLVVSVSPNIVRDGGVHVLAGGVEIFLAAFNLIGEGGFGDCQRDFVLCAARSSGRRRRVALQGADTGQRPGPELLLAAMRPLP